MKLTDEQLILIEKYCSDELNELEKKALKAIPNWEEAVEFHQHFLDVIPISKTQQIKSQLFLFEEELQQEQKVIQSRSHILNKIQQKIALTLNELASLFLPVPHYQANLAMANRSGNLVVKKPREEENASSNLTFELMKPTTHPLQLTIENNLQTLLIEKQIPKNTKGFQVSLKNLENIPGRYYWRLVMDREVTMGVFFIQKDLMPSQ